MAQYKSEYTNSAVGSPGCAYKTGCGRTMTHLFNPYPTDGLLPHTHTHTHLSNLTPTRLRNETGVFLTPDYAGIGYDALTHGVSGGCQQYFNIQDAYGYGAGKCKTSYTSRACGCDDYNGVGKGMDWVCTGSKLLGGGKCVGVHKGAQRPPGAVYPTSYECQANCKPGQHR